MLRVKDGQLTVNDQVLPHVLTGIQELLGKFTAHAVEGMIVESECCPADLLGTARVLATATAEVGDGRVIDAQLRALALRTVRVTFRKTNRIAVDGAIDANMVQAFPRPVHREEVGDGADDLFAQLDATTSVAVASRLLDQIVALVEANARSNRSLAAADAMSKVVAREAGTTEADLKRAYGGAVRRLSKPTSLRAVASLEMPQHKVGTRGFFAVLARAGDEGAEALIEQLDGCAVAVGAAHLLQCPRATQGRRYDADPHAGRPALVRGPELSRSVRGSSTPSTPTRLSANCSRTTMTTCVERQRTRSASWGRRTRSCRCARRSRIPPRTCGQLRPPGWPSAAGPGRREH